MHSSLSSRLAVVTLLGLLCLTSLPAQKKAKQKPLPPPIAPQFVLLPPPPGYNARLRQARASARDDYWRQVKNLPGGVTYDSVKNFLAPLKYVNAPWRYAGVILSPKGSPEKMRVIENGFQIDAGLTRRSPLDVHSVWAEGDTHLWVRVGPQDELFGLDEHRQGRPHYRRGYLPVFQVTYRSAGVLYREQVLAAPMQFVHRAYGMSGPGIAAYVRLTAVSGPGEVALQMQAPPVGYGFPIVPPGFRHDRWTDAHNNAYAWFSAGAHYDVGAGLVRYRLARGQSAYVVLPHSLQLAGTQVRVGAQAFRQARAAVDAQWRDQLAGGGEVHVPEKVVMNAYRSLLIGDWQVSIGDELPYGMFSYYQGNGYAEAQQSIAPMIEYGYFADARRFIQPILDYPLSDTGIGLDVCAVRLELATYYYALSRDAGFIRHNEVRLRQVADYLLAHRDASDGLIRDGYGFDLATQRVVNLNTNSNGWRAIRDLGVTLQDVGAAGPGAHYLRIAHSFGGEVRQAIEHAVDHSTTPPFVPFALGVEHPYPSLVASREASYYNILIPYFLQSRLFSPWSKPFTDALDYQWRHQGVMAGLNRFRGYSGIYGQDGIHPLYTWGREYEQIARHDTRRALYTFYCALAHGYTRGTFLTGEAQSTRPSSTEWQRAMYLPPEPPANAMLLRTLRTMLLYEYDQNEDGIYGQLWLLSSTPRGWLANGKSIRLDHMPSRFGRVSLRLSSHLRQQRLTGSLQLPAGIAGKKVLVFLRLPHPCAVKQAHTAQGALLPVMMAYGDPVLQAPAQPGRLDFNVELKGCEK